MQVFSFLTALLMVLSPVFLQAKDGDILFCASGGNLSCVKKLIKDDPNVLFAKDAKGNTPLILAAAHGQNSIIQLIAGQCANWGANNNASNALHAAAAAGHTETVRLILSLVREDPDTDFSRFLNARDTANRASPLHLAAARCDTSTYQLLVSAGADVSLKDAAGRTAANLLAHCTKQKATDKARQTSSGSDVKIKKSDENKNLSRIKNPA